jgi:hypothetical protein
MSITLEDIELPEDLLRTDEFGGWSPVKREHTQGSTGKLIVQAGLLKEGRPITLESTSNSAWARRAVVNQIYAELLITEPMTLTIHGQQETVTWAPDSPFTAEPVTSFTDPDDTDFYMIKLKFITIEAPQ